VLDDAHTSAAPAYDRGATYSPLACTGCKRILGRLYLTTPRHLDALRDAFTFDLDRLEAYTVGSGAPASDVAELSLNDILDLPTVVSLRAEITQV
jgi:hypothetical protein